MRLLKMKTNQICPRTKEFFKRRFSPKSSRHGSSVVYGGDDFDIDFSTITTPSAASSRRDSLYEYVDSPTVAAADVCASGSSPSTATYAARGNTYSARNVDPAHYYGGDYYDSYRCDDDSYPCGCCCYGFFSPFCCGASVHDENDVDEKKHNPRRRRTNSQIKTSNSSNNANGNAAWEKTDYNPHRSLTGFVLWCRLTWVKVGRTFR